MDYAFLSIIGSLVGTIPSILAFVYLYFMYRERYICLWIIAWCVFFLRIILFDSGIIDWKQSIIGFLFYQLLFIGCGPIYVWGMYIFIDRQFNKWWIYGAVGASMIGIVFFLLHYPLLFRVIPPAWFGGIVLMWIGLIFLRYTKLKGIGKYITGIAFIIWGVLTIILPFTIHSFHVFVALSGGTLRLIIAVGTLLVYFEKTRMELVEKETQYRLFAENAVDIIFRYKLLPEAKFEFISSSVYAVTGYNPEEYYADSELFFNSVHPDDALSVNDYFTASDHPGEPLAFRLFNKNQKIVWVEQKCASTCDNANRV